MIIYAVSTGSDEDRTQYAHFSEREYADKFVELFGEAIKGETWGDEVEIEEIEVDAILHHVLAGEKVFHVSIYGEESGVRVHPSTYYYFIREMLDAGLDYDDPHHWSVYVWAKDEQAAMEKAVKLLPK